MLPSYENGGTCTFPSKALGEDQGEQVRRLRSHSAVIKEDFFIACAFYFS